MNNKFLSKHKLEMNSFLSVSQIFLLPFIFLASCGGGGSSSPVVSKVSIVSPPLAVQLNKTVQLVVAVSDPSGNLIPNPSINWSADAGSISSGGIYSAPSKIPAQNPVTIKATAAADATKSATLSLMILTGSSLTFTNPPVDETASLGNPTGTSKIQMAVYQTNIYLAWVSTDQNNISHLYYSKGNRSGQFSTPHDILSDISSYPGPFKPSNPVILLDNKIDANGDPGVYIAWDDNGPSSNYQVLGVKGPNVNSCSSGHLPCFTPFALTGAGNISSLQIDPVSTSQQFPSMAFNPLGRIEFAWTQTYAPTTSFSGGQFVTYKELKSDGSVLNGPFPVAQSSFINEQFNSQIGVDSLGNISIAWIDYGGQNASPPNIYYSRLLSGKSFGSPTQVESAQLKPNDTFSMALDHVGQPYLAWSNSNALNPSGSGIFFSTTTDFVSFNPPVKLTTVGNGYNPTLKIDLLGSLYFSWDGGSSTYFSKVDPVSSPLNININQISNKGFNPTMDIGIDGRSYLLYSSTSSIGLSTYYSEGE